MLNWKSSEIIIRTIILKIINIPLVRQQNDDTKFYYWTSNKIIRTHASITKHFNENYMSIFELRKHITQ